MEKEKGKVDEIIEALKGTYCYKGDYLLTYLECLDELYEQSKDDRYKDEYIKVCDLFDLCPKCKTELSYCKAEEPFGECRGNKCYQNS